MAEKLNVKLVNGDDLVSMVDELDAEELMTQYDIDGTEEMQSQMRSQSIPSRENTIASAESKNGFLSKTEQARDWHSILLKTTGLAFVSLLIAVLSDGTSIGLLKAVSSAAEVVLGISIIAVAIALYLDIRYVRRHNSWNPTTWMYLIGLFAFYFTIPLYLYRRRTAT